MSFSFGNLVKTAKPPSQVTPLSFGYPVGDTRNNSSIYDDGPLRAVRSAGRPVAKSASNPSPLKLSFGTSVPSYSDPFASGNNLSLGAYKPQGSTTSLFPKVSDFLSTASFGFDVGDTRNSSPAVYDDGVLRASRVQPIPKVNTGVIDGGSSILGVLKGAAKEALAGMGSSGDGEVIKTSYETPGNGINPWWIAGGAVLAGALYYAYAK